MGIRNLSRDTALKIHHILDQWIPPAIRDCPWIMSIPLRVMFGRHYKIYMHFKDKAYALTDQEFSDVYQTVADTAVKRETDLNLASIQKIKEHVSGPKVLDVGCGRGFLVKELSANYEVTGVDIVVPRSLREQYPTLIFQEAAMENLPFLNKSFDTVISTHTLEHVRNIHEAIAELRRVGKKVIIIVPKQRPYKYTFDLHLNFFPYRNSLLSVMGKTKGEVICEDIDDDIFYVEEITI